MLINQHGGFWFSIRFRLWKIENQCHQFGKHAKNQTYGIESTPKRYCIVGPKKKNGIASVIHILECNAFLDLACILVENWLRFFTLLFISYFIFPNKMRGRQPQQDKWLHIYTYSEFII